jgi:hypothetical protein
MAEEQKVGEAVKEVVEEVQPDAVASEGEIEGKVADRPEQNFRAELARKNKEIERLRQEAELRKNEQGQKRDQNDLSTWSDHELKAVLKDPSPAAAPYKDQIEDIILERKVKAMREKERMQEKRALSDLEIKTSYPDALDPSSELAVKMEQVMYDYDLQKSPAGRLAAAKIAAAELGKGRSKSTAQERKAEAERVARVKGNMVDGDRSRSTDGNSPAKKAEDIEKSIKNASLLDASGISDALKARGMDRKNFFGR